MGKLIMACFSCLLSIGSMALWAGDSSSYVQQAASNNKQLYVFFYKEQSEKTHRLESIFDQAIAKLGQQVVAVKVDVTDPSERPLVDRFDLKRAPMPFVVVMAPNGAITGGFPSFTEEQLLGSLTSPGAAQCLKALQDRKLVLLCLQSKDTTDNQAALAGVYDFKNDPRFASASEVVIIDPSDKKEQKFLEQLSLDTHSPRALTVLISPPADVIGTYSGVITKAQMVSDLQNAASGCCCPGGCCPGGCCPGGKCGPAKGRG